MATSQTDTRPEIEGPGLIESLRQYWRLAAAIVIACALLGVAVSFILAPTYSSTARIGLKQPANIGGPTGMERNTATIALFARSDEVLAPAAAALGDVTVKKLRSETDAVADAVANVVAITATSDTAEAAVERADAVVASLQAAIGKRASDTTDAKLKGFDAKRTEQNKILKDPTSTTSQRAAATQVLQETERQELQVTAEAADFGNGVAFVTKGLLPSESGLKATALQGILGGLVGFIIALVVCWIVADRRRVVEDVAVPGLLTDSRMLAEVPVYKGSAAAALGQFAEMPAMAYEFAAAGLWAGIDSGVVMVSGVDRGAGATTTAANVAAAFARDGRRVALVDADGSGLSLTRIAGIPDGTAGLSDVLAQRAPIEDALRAVDLGDTISVAVLPCGRPDSDLASLMRGKTMSDTLDRLREWYDLVIVDVPPLVSTAHGASIARSVDGVVFVTTRGVRLRRIERLRERLELLDLPVFGYIFNRDQAIEINYDRPGANARR